MESMDLIILIAIGLSAGLAGGMLGVGGSIVMIPALTEVLGPNQHAYQATAMIVNFCVVVPAVIQHRRAGAIDARTVKRIIPLALIAVLVGVGMSEFSVFSGTGEKYLRGMFALFLGLVIAHDGFRLISPRTEPTSSLSVGLGKPDRANDFALPFRKVVMIAIPTGFMAGLLGLGGGMLAVPLQRRLLGVSIRTAISNSAAIIVVTSFVGAIAKNYAHMNDGGDTRTVMLAAFLAPAAIIGSFIGSYWTHRLPIRFIKGGFLILMVFAAVRLAMVR